MNRGCGGRQQQGFLHWGRLCMSRPKHQNFVCILEILIAWLSCLLAMVTMAQRSQMEQLERCPLFVGTDHNRCLLSAETDQLDQLCISRVAYARHTNGAPLCLSIRSSNRRFIGLFAFARASTAALTLMLRIWQLRPAPSRNYPISSIVTLPGQQMQPKIFSKGTTLTTKNRLSLGTNGTTPEIE